MRKKRLGELDAIVTGGSDGNGGGHGPIAVLLHGFGAPGTDLVGLGEVLEDAVANSAAAANEGTDHALRCVFPLAPLLLDPRAGAADDAPRAWWMIDVVALQVAAMTGDVRALIEREPAGIAEVRAKLDALLDAVERELQPSKLLVGGFSQGAMLATDTVLRSTRPIAGLMVLSGALISASVWAEHAPARAGLPVFQSHGRADPILPFAVATLLRERLGAAGLAVDWVEFGGGHGIPPVTLERLGRFIARVTHNPSG